LRWSLDHGKAAPDLEESQSREASRQRQAPQVEAPQGPHVGWAGKRTSVTRAPARRQGVDFVAEKDFLVDLALVDFDRPIATLDEIRKYNPQRFEMEQLTAVVYADEKEVACVGYKDITHSEFWCRGHMPGMPLMPGVVMLESVAQLCSFVTQKFDLLGAEMVGFGGLENVRFRDPVVPGDRLIVMCKLEKVRRGRMIVCQFQAAVKDRIVLEGQLKGIPIPIEALQKFKSGS
jgi:3-hydroxyacyl-[acyl-carrier-protein] dehydratase